MSTFGHVFRVHTFGESHGQSVGCVIDGCPPGVVVTEELIQTVMNRRRPGQSEITTTRQEFDHVEIHSGVENSVSLGTPITLLVRNQDTRSRDYAAVKDTPRPGHADATWKSKFGISASSGGGRASARETVGRVAAGAVAMEFLRQNFHTEISCFVDAIYKVSLPVELRRQYISDPPSRANIDRLGSVYRLSSDESDLLIDCDGNFYRVSDGNSVDDIPDVQLISDRLPISDLTSLTLVGSVRCPHPITAVRMVATIRKFHRLEDSLGGSVTCVVRKCPGNLGEPVFDKTSAMLAHAMLSIPATKGFEFGEGFGVCDFRGSQHNDCFVRRCPESGLLISDTNHSGGTLGGLTTGGDLYFRVAFKPVSSIALPQTTCDFNGNLKTLTVTGRHDPCVLPRCPVIVESMCALVLADLCLRQWSRGSPSLCPSSLCFCCVPNGTC